MLRILTEDLDRPGINKILIGLGIRDFTLYPAQGFWKGDPENTLILEFDGYPEILIRRAAREIAALNNQSAVLVQSIESTEVLVEQEQEQEQEEYVSG